MWRLVKIDTQINQPLVRSVLHVRENGQMLVFGNARGTYVLQTLSLIDCRNDRKFDMTTILV